MPSRRALIQMNPAEIDAFCNEQKTIIIISNGKDGYPHPMPMWFYRDADGCFYCSTFRSSQKVLNYRRDPRASLLLESGEEYTELKSVLIYAAAEIIEDDATVVESMVKMRTRGQTLSEAEREHVAGAVTKTAAKRVLLKFTPERYVSWNHSKLGGRY